MTLYQLRQFVALAKEKHFGRTAKLLGIEQPPLSQCIQRLERELGVQLLDRSSRSVELTGPGKVFLRKILQALALIEMGTTAARHVQEGMVGQLRVAFNTPTGYALVPRILRAFRERRPNVELNLLEMESSKQVEALLEDKVDVGFMRCVSFEDESIHVERLMRDRIVAALPKNHRLARCKVISLSDLRDEPFVMPPHRLPTIFSGPSYHSQILSACQEAGFTPRIAQEVNRIDTVASLVAAGIGVTLLTTSLRGSHRPGVVYKDLRDHSALLHVDLGMAWRKNNPSPILPTFIELAKAISKSLPKTEGGRGPGGAKAPPPGTCWRRKDSPPARNGARRSAARR